MRTVKIEVNKMVFETLGTDKLIQGENLEVIYAYRIGYNLYRKSKLAHRHLAVPIEVKRRSHEYGRLLDELGACIGYRIKNLGKPIQIFKFKWGTKGECLGVQAIQLGSNEQTDITRHDLYLLKLIAGKRLKNATITEVNNTPTCSVFKRRVPYLAIQGGIRDEMRKTIDNEDEINNISDNYKMLWDMDYVHKLNTAASRKKDVSYEISKEDAIRYITDAGFRDEWTDECAKAQQFTIVTLGEPDYIHYADPILLPFEGKSLSEYGRIYEYDIRSRALVVRSNNKLIVYIPDTVTTLADMRPGTRKLRKTCTLNAAIRVKYKNELQNKTIDTIEMHGGRNANDMSYLKYKLDDIKFDFTHYRMLEGDNILGDASSYREII